MCDNLDLCQRHLAKVSNKCLETARSFVDEVPGELLQSYYWLELGAHWQIHRLGGLLQAPVDPYQQCCRAATS